MDYNVSFRKFFCEKEYNLYFCIMMRRVKTFTKIIIGLIVIVLFFETNLKSKSNNENNTIVSLLRTDTATNESSISSFNQPIEFDIPLPLEGISEQILYRNYYIVSYNKDNRLPNWVAWHLTPKHTNGDVKRPGSAWHEDFDVPSPRATIADYKGSGWTRGHMCPAGDNKWDSDAMYNTFLLSNCCPQNANLNSGTWNQIEISTRRWAEKWGDLYIVCGPILFRQEHETIGENKVVVPEAFFKVIVCLNNKHPKGIGFICRNTDGNRKKDLYVNSVKQVERITGITFFPHLPKELADAVKNDAYLECWE